MNNLFSFIVLISSVTFNTLVSPTHVSLKLIGQQNVMESTQKKLQNILEDIYGRGSGGQQQGDLEFITTTAPLVNGTQQVDWVFDNQGRCWSAWSAQKCSLQAHTGGVTVPSMRDFNNDGKEDIECSAGSVENSTQIKNISNQTIPINCETYNCNACTSGNGTHSQCDGGIDKNANRVSKAFNLTPGCVATCTMNGAYGTCLDQTTPPNDTISVKPDTPQPTAAITISPPTDIPNSQSPSNTLDPDDTGGNEFTDLITKATIEPILINLIDDDTTTQVDQKQTRVTGSAGYTTELLYIQGLFQKAGITSLIQDATGVETAYINHTCPKDIKIQNLIARIPGKNTATKYVLTAHLDSKNQTTKQTGPAPGADDNASGVAALVGTAQALIKQRGTFEHTIEFVIFGGNKQGLCGSAFYMDQYKKNLGKEVIKGVINLDMIGYPLENKQDCVNFEYKKTKFDDVLSNALIAKRDSLNILLQGSSKASERNDSDHKHFWDNNIPAVLVTACRVNPNFNTASDVWFRSEQEYFLNLNQIVKTSQVVGATVLDLARATDTANPTPTSAMQATPTTNTKQPTNAPTPTNRPAGNHMPVAIDYSSYIESYNQAPPTYVYAMMNRAYNAQNTTRGIQGLAQIKGNVVKMIMVSEYLALEQILKNHSEALKTAGITWVGYNAERDGRTPQNELANMANTNATQNTVNKFGRLAHQYGFKLMFGPTTPMWNEFLGGQNAAGDPALAKAMIGDNCYLDGIAFQEQKQITKTNKQQRADIVAARAKLFRDNAPACPQFEVMVQIMSMWCQQDASWEECRGYYHLLRDLGGQSKINSLAIWASGEDKKELQKFIEFLRQ